MIHADRTVKILLGIIALFLGILVLNPLFKLATSAWAQSTEAVPNSDGLVSIGSRIVDVSSILTDSGKTVRGVYPMDKAQCFIVQYDDHFRVFRVLDVRVPPSSVTQAAQAAAAATSGAHLTLSH